MFRKFFTRIQPIIIEMFQANPARAVAILGLQAYMFKPLDENINKYAFMRGLENKFDINPLGSYGQVFDTHLISPSVLDWIPLLSD